MNQLAVLYTYIGWGIEVDFDINKLTFPIKNNNSKANKTSRCGSHIPFFYVFRSFLITKLPNQNRFGLYIPPVLQFN